MSKKLMNLRLDEELIERTKVAAKDAGESLTQYAATAIALRLDPPVIGEAYMHIDPEPPIPPYIRGPGISKAANVPPPEPKAPKEAAAPIIQEARRSLERTEVETHFKT